MFILNAHTIYHRRHSKCQNYTTTAEVCVIWQPGSIDNQVGTALVAWNQHVLQVVQPLLIYWIVSLSSFNVCKMHDSGVERTRPARTAVIGRP